MQEVPPDNRPPFASAIEWVSRITVIALEMVLPGLVGKWLDSRFGTGFLVLVGFALGLVGGMWHLLLLTGAMGRKKSPPRDKDSKQ